MLRREFIATLSGAAAWCPSNVRHQNPSATHTTYRWLTITSFARPEEFG